MKASNVFCRVGAIETQSNEAVWALEASGDDLGRSLEWIRKKYFRSK